MCENLENEDKFYTCSQGMECKRSITPDVECV